MPKFTVSSVAAILAVLVNGGLCRMADVSSVGELSSGFTLYGLGEDKSSELTGVFSEPNGLQHGTKSDGKNDIDALNYREYSDFGNEIRHGDDGYEPGAQEPGGDDDGAGQNYYDDDTEASRGFDENASHIAPAKYITGGTATGVTLYPWVARLIVKHEVEGEIKRSLCGGSLVSWRHVITAAHCVPKNIKFNVDVSVYLAEYNTRTFPDDCEGSQCVENVLMHPDKIIVHPRFQYKTLYNDIALLRLSQYAPNNGFIRPITLPTFNVNDRRYEGAPVIVTGWGLTEYGQLSPIKQHVQVELMAPETCRRFRPSVNQGILCAAGRNGKNKCSGDSGGPLMAQYDGKLHLVGLVSFRITSNCTTYMPSMYTNVYTYLEWIKKSMRGV